VIFSSSRSVQTPDSDGITREKGEGIGTKEIRRKEKNRALPPQLSVAFFSIPVI
jgi:hypothetical protein